MPYNYPNKSPTNAKLSKVPGKSEGLKLTLKVMAGDTLEISAKAFYNMDNAFPGKSINIVPIVGAVLAGMYNPLSTVGEYSQLANNPGTTASNSTILPNLPEENNQNRTVQPQSGINFVLYNNEFDVVEANTGYLPVDDKINAIQVLAKDKLVMTEAGFIEIFANNEAVTPVYYDNMMVVMSSVSVSEVNAYYSFGKRIPILSSPFDTDNLSNKYLYNEKEIQEMTGWHDFGARMLNGERWFIPDPKSEKYYNTSNYAYCLNNPIKFIDPDGREVIEADNIKNTPAYRIYSSTPMAKIMYDKFTTGAMAAHTLSFQTHGESTFGAYVVTAKTKTPISEVTASQLTGEYSFEFKINLLSGEKEYGSGATILGHEVFLHGEKEIEGIQNLIKNGITGEKLAKELNNLGNLSQIKDNNGNIVIPKTGSGGADHAKYAAWKDDSFQKYVKQAKNVADDEKTRKSIQNHYDSKKKEYSEDPWIIWWNSTHNR